MLKILVVILSISTIAYGQKDSTLLRNNHRFGLYPEIGGNGGLYSGSFEYLFLVKNRTHGGYVRVGQGALYEGGSSSFIESGFLIGKPQKYFDIGLGYTSFNSNNEFKEYLYALRLGYRYQGEKGFLFRIAPLLINKYESDGNEFAFWLGISLGYSFRLNEK